jgi:hypothetical protein
VFGVVAPLLRKMWAPLGSIATACSAVTALSRHPDAANAAFTEILSSVVQNAVDTVRNDTLAQVPQMMQSTLQGQTLEQAITELESTYDVLRAGSETFDQALVDDVLALQRAYMDRGMPPADALKKATRMGLQDHYPDVLAPAATVVPPPPPPKPSRDVARNVQASQQQPPELPARQDTGELDRLMSRVTELSDDELDALPESTLRWMRLDCCHAIIWSLCARPQVDPRALSSPTTSALFSAIARQHC